MTLIQRSGTDPVRAPALAPRRRIRSGSAPARLLVALAALAALLLAGCSSEPSAGAGGPAGAVGTADVATPPLDPDRLEVPAIGATSSLIGLGRDAAGGWAIPPLDQPGQASWYSDGIVPGSPGPAVILGHINGCAALNDAGRCAGEHVPGVFSRLAEMRAGDEAIVTGRDGRAVRFVATRDAQVVDKGAFPADQVLARTADRQLSLVSCGGDYDPVNRRYLANVIVPMVAAA